MHIGGPNFLALPDGRLVAAVRLHHPTTRTAICWLDSEAGRLDEILALPSKGDTSYAGLVHHEGLLWVSYYSAHEGRGLEHLSGQGAAAAASSKPDRSPLSSCHPLVAKRTAASVSERHGPKANLLGGVRARGW